MKLVELGRREIVDGCYSRTTIWFKGHITPYFGYVSYRHIQGLTGPETEAVYVHIRPTKTLTVIDHNGDDYSETHRNGRRL